MGNGYLLTERMRPLIEVYSNQGMKFLAVKLQEGFTASAITPLRMTYPGTAPMIPLELTAVGAEPDMPVIAFIAGEQRWQSSNFSNFRVDPADIRLDPNTGSHNYSPLLSWVVDQHQGLAFATEFAGRTAGIPLGGVNPDEAAWLGGVFSRHSYVTRMRTRISAVEMRLDPEFEPSEGGTCPRRWTSPCSPPWRSARPRVPWRPAGGLTAAWAPAACQRPPGRPVRARAGRPHGGSVAWTASNRSA